ncbi:MAG: ribonuclease HII [Candidatus Aenigmatarchaeota archaeon]
MFYKVINILICGIDEAGRGAIIGPMVISGVVIDSRDEKKLKMIGVKDSKLLSPKRRKELARKIEEIARNVIVLRIQPCKIDAYRAKKINLDKIEAMKMAEIIDICGARKVFVDSLEQNAEKFKELILSFLKNKKVDLVVENYLDESIPVVSAASIIAKVNRDEVIEEIKKKEGFDFGVGYSHDVRTIEFIKKLMKEREGQLPSYVRQSWSTIHELKNRSIQQKIKDFFKKDEKCKEGKSEG